MCEVNDMEVLTFNNEIAVLGISTDGPYSHQQFIGQNDISYPLLTDDNKTVYEQYGMIKETDDDTRQPKRGIVLLDDEQVVRYRWEAADNWDKWTMEPLHEAYEIAKEYLNSREQ